MNDADLKIIEDEAMRLLNKNAEVIDEVKKNSQPKNDKEEEETFFVNVLDFVMSYLSKVFADSTTQTSTMIWLKDWWKYPAIVARLNALWISWERSYKSNQLETWFLNIAEPMMKYITNKEHGTMVHYISESGDNLSRVTRGSYLETDMPDHKWFNRVTGELKSLGRSEIDSFRKRRQNNTKVSASFL